MTTFTTKPTTLLLTIFLKNHNIIYQQVTFTQHPTDTDTIHYNFKETINKQHAIPPSHIHNHTLLDRNKDFSLEQAQYLYQYYISKGFKTK